MRIGFEAKRAFHNFRGLGNYARTLLEGLVQFAPEHEYIAFTPAFDDARAHAWLQKLKAEGGQLQVETPREHGAWAMAPEVWRRWGVPRIADIRQVDVFHGLSHELPQLSARSHVKKIVTVHDVIFMRYPQFFPWIDRQVYRWKLQHACQSADMIVAICQQTAQDLQEFLHIPQEKIRVVYQAMAPIFEKIPTQAQQCEILKQWQLEQKNYLLMVGAYEARKNQENLIRALARLPDSPPLLLIGRGERQQAELQKLVQELKLATRVRFLTQVPFAHLPALYAGALASIYPSHFEGFGLPLIESLSQGTPVVTSQGSCFPEAAGPGALYTDPRQVDSIAAGIDKMIHDQGLRQKLAQEGSAYVERYRLRVTTDNLKAAYRDVITSR